ncbi:MAG: hypothetical protein KGM96_15200 [Acidobacteriota bacterium]|nr:hypothetical protein [Acidobacteriota bacterium]
MSPARVIAMAALAFLGLSSLAGAIPMIVDPSGAAMQMPLSLLRHSPFHSFLIPGILLLLFDGVLALWVLWLAMMAKPRHGLWIVFQGCVLLVWLAVECVMLRMVIWPHYLYGAVALVLVVSGLSLRRENGHPTPAQG